MDRRALQLISHDFRDLVSQASRSHYGHLQTNLQKLIDFVESTPLIADYVHAAPRPNLSPLEVIEQCKKHRERISPVRDRQEELGFLHDLLVAMANMDDREFQSLIAGYGYHQKFQDSVEELVSHTLSPYAGYIRRIITSALTQTDGTAVPRFTINTSGGLSQVVVHQGTGDINTQQSAVASASEVQQLAEALLRYLESNGATLPPQSLEELKSIARDLPVEVAREKPSRWGLKAIQEKLDFYITASEVAESVKPYIQPLLGALSAYLAAHGFR